MRSTILAGLALFALAAGAARAGVLFEGKLERAPIRAELGASPARVRLVVEDRDYLVDLDRQRVYRRFRTGLRPVAVEDRGLPLDGFRLERWYAGPRVAGYASSYHVLRRDEAICAEVLASRWIGRMLAPLVRAIALVQGVDEAIRPKARGRCGAVPFEVYARAGFPLMAGWKDEPVFVTERLRFDHAVAAGDLALPEER